MHTEPCTVAGPLGTIAHTRDVRIGDVEHQGPLTHVFKAEPEAAGILLQKVKLLAVKQGTSVSTLMARVLEDIVAEELRLAAGQLGRLIGRVDVEDILDVIFRDFCIGK